MTFLKHPSLTLAVAAFVTASLAACGGGGGSKASGAPTAASTSDFCTAYKSGDQAFAKLGTDDYDGAATALHDVAGKLKDTGTPAGIPADARSGFEVLVDFASGISADTLKSAAAKAQAAASSGSSNTEDQIAGLLGISSDDAKKIDTFTAWAGKAC